MYDDSVSVRWCLMICISVRCDMMIVYLCVDVWWHVFVRWYMMIMYLYVDIYNDNIICKLTYGGNICLCLFVCLWMYGDSMFRLINGDNMIVCWYMVAIWLYADIWWQYDCMLMYGGYMIVCWYMVAVYLFVNMHGGKYICMLIQGNSMSVCWHDGHISILLVLVDLDKTDLYVYLYTCVDIQFS